MSSFLRYREVLYIDDNLTTVYDIADSKKYRHMWKELSRCNRLRPIESIRKIQRNDL